MTVRNMHMCIIAYLVVLNVSLDDCFALLAEEVREVLTEFPSVARGQAKSRVFTRGYCFVVSTGNQVHAVLLSAVNSKDQLTISVLESTPPERRLMSLSNS